MIFDVLLRIEAEPYQRDPARGWAAELADPVWFLGRQWQLGEHQGEDASSPVGVDLTVTAVPVRPAASQPGLDPATAPAQAVIESEPGDWWTNGRRVRTGRAVAAAAAAHGVTLPVDGVALTDLPVPYDAITGPDGRLLWERRAALGLDPGWFGTPAPPESEPADFWDPAQLAYSASLPTGAGHLDVIRHDGGDLDWYHADAGVPPGPGGTTTAVRTLPGRLRYPSAPLPRWWQIEDAQVSIGGQAPDRAGIATLLLIDLIVNHSDDWFTLTVPVTTGSVTRIDAVVADSFGDTWPLAPPHDWSLFATRGLDPGALVVWATARTPLAGPILDQVTIGIDEDANLVWAVEQVVAGRTLPTPDPPAGPPPRQRDAADAPTYAYLPMTPIPRYWHPYVVEDVGGRRSFVQGRAADLSGSTPVLLPAPVSDLLADPHRGPGDPVHRIEPSAVPAEGLLIQRRAMLARATTGEPLLWRQRRREVIALSPPLGLRFDVLPED